MSVGVAGAQEVPESRVVVSGLEFPAGIAFLSDGSLIVNERAGVVNVVREGVIEAVAEIPTTTDGETGLLGVAVPAEQEDEVFVFATEADGVSNTIWRVPLGGAEPTRVIVDLPAAFYHNGGGVGFGQDGMLYVSNGEQHDTARAQDPQALGGKIYRFTPDGDIPDDNPFPGSPAFALGLRNPYGLTIDPLSGAPWVTENGPSGYDEINRVVPAANFGWPTVSGPAEANEADAEAIEDYQDPVLSYEDTIVPTGIAFAESTGGGVSRGDLFFASYGEGSIHHVVLDEDRETALSDEVIVEAGAPVIALAWGPDGLYYSTPEEVRMVPLGAPEASSGTPSEETPADPVDASGRGTPNADEGAPAATRILGVGLVLLLVVGLIAYRRWLRPQD